MATVYHNWASQTTASGKLTHLRLFMGEIQAQMGAPDVAADGKSVDRSALNTLLQTLREAEKDLVAGGAGGGGVFVTRRRR